MTKLHADFNGLFGGLLCLAHGDTCVDADGVSITLREGMTVTAFEEELVATGTVEPSPDWLQCKGSKWALRIDALGVRHEANTALD
jgi:hypothetical protein